MLNPEQITTSNKTAADTLFGLTQRAFEGVEKLVELNVQASKAALAENASHAQTLLGVKDAQELLALQASLLQPLAEKTAAYNRHLFDIATTTGAEVGRVVEAQTAQAQEKLSSLMESTSQNAPAGTEAVVALIKSAVAAANNAFESAQKSIKHASDIAEANFNAVSTSATNAAKSASKKAS